MFGWADLLNRYKINNKGFRLEDKDEFLKLECPCLAHLGDRFVIVKHITEEQIEYLWNGQTIHSKFDLFKQMWTGNVLCAYPDEFSEEVEYTKHRTEGEKEWFKNLVICIVCCSLIVYGLIINYRDKSAISYLPLLINASGLYVSYLLLLKQLHIESRIADRFCSLLKQNSCHDLLDTKASKFFNLFGWSELGVAYFSVNIILLLFSPLMFFSVLALISFCSLTYPLWSILYQYLNKQWCTLCLCIQFLLIAQFVIYILFVFFTNIKLFNIYDLLSATYIIPFFIVLAFYGLSLLIINKLVPIITKSKLASQWKQTANSFKMKDDVFKSLLKEEKQFDMSNASNICIGKSESKLTLSIFSNPYCNPCAAMHARIDELLGYGTRVQYIFTSFNEDLAKTNRYLIACYQTLPQEQFIKILREWFAGGKREGNEFFKNFNLDILSASVEEEFKCQQAWTKLSCLHATPTLLLDGYLLPPAYQVEDVSYFMDLDLS